MSKPTLVLDFDGVLHSYKSGWQGARHIPDPPVPGALEALLTYLRSFRVAIVSSRSHQWGGRRAMKRWLRYHLIAAAGDYCHTTPWWLRDHIMETAFVAPWKTEVRYAVKLIVEEIEFPRHKPAALMTIDDRAHQFDGTWPTTLEIFRFKPWNKRP